MSPYNTKIMTFGIKLALTCTILFNFINNVAANSRLTAKAYRELHSRTDNQNLRHPKSYHPHSLEYHDYHSNLPHESRDYQTQLVSNAPLRDISSTSWRARQYGTSLSFQNEARDNHHSTLPHESRDYETQLASNAPLRDISSTLRYTSQYGTSRSFVQNDAGTSSINLSSRERSSSNTIIIISGIIGIICCTGGIVYLKFMAAQAKEDKKLVISDDDDRSIMSVTDGTVTKKKKTGKKTGKKKKKKKLGPISKDDEETKLLKIAIKSGRGFQIERKRMKKDIPDVYCIAIFGTKKWRTSTIQDDVKPKWNESELFAVRTGDPHIIELEAWDANGSGRSDDLYGTIDIPIQELLLKPDNTMEVELLDKSKKGLGIFITLSGQLVSKTTVDDVRRVQVTVVKGNGFKVLKKKFGLMKDIPDIYCKVKVEGNYGDWQTKTIQDSQAPVWYESKTYNISTENQKIKLEAWDENDKRPDEYYGALEVKVKKLLSNAGPMALELKGSDGKGLGLFITLGCKFVKDN